jgi:hypothetical protein
VIDPNTILFAIRAAIRLGRVISQQMEAAIRDRGTTMPNVIRLYPDPLGSLRSTLDKMKGQLTPEQWTAYNNLVARDLQGDRAAEGEIFAFARSVGLVAQVEQAQDERGLTVIQQWREGTNQNQPLARIGLALLEVALDYATTNPAVFGVGSNGERMIRAIAQAVQEIIPHADDTGVITAESLFSERSVAILMHAALATLQEHIADNVGETQLCDIATAVLKPLTANFENGKIERATLHDFRDLLLGPMTQAAIQAVARNQDAFLGDKFDKDKPLGALTGAILSIIANEKTAGGGQRWNIADNVLDRTVWLKVYTACLDVAVQRPELFVGKRQDDTSIFARDLVKTVADGLNQMTPPFAAEVAAAVASNAITVLSRHTVILFDEKAPWDEVARGAVGSVLTSVAAGMKAGLKSETVGGATTTGEEILKRVFSQDEVAALIHIVVEQAAKTPQMIVGSGERDEVKALVAGVARAISDSNRSLLSGDDWLEVAALLAEQAAKNPGRLFKLVPANQAASPDEDLAVKIIATLLQAAAADLKARGRGKGSVLFGTTLKEVIVETLALAGDNAAAAATKAGQDALIALIKRINKLQGDTAMAFGGEAWLRIFRRYALPSLIGGVAAVNALLDDELRKLIGAMAA